MSRYWWGEGNRPSPRLALEIAAMKDLFPLNNRKRIDPGVSWDGPFEIEALSLELDRSDPSGINWNITYRMHEIPGSDSRVDHSGKITLNIQYTPIFPDDEPRARFDKPAIRHGPHMFMGGILCLHEHGNRSRGWDPAHSTAATFGLWAVQWFRARLYYDATGDWPSAS